MDFRKIFFGFVFLIFGNWNFAQMDSTDLNFYVHESDSLNSSNFQQLFLEFELNESLPISNVNIEVVFNNTDANAATSFQQTFTLSELSPFQMVSENFYQIDLGQSMVGLTYQVFLTLVDANGHEIISISKFLVL